MGLGGRGWGLLGVGVGAHLGELPEEGEEREDEEHLHGEEQVVPPVLHVELELVAHLERYRGRYRIDEGQIG